MSLEPDRGNAVVVSDLDRTLLYSPAAMGLSMPDAEAPRMLCVEVYRSAPQSFLTETAAGHVAALAEVGRLVPVTTRTVAQYQRITLPGPPAAFALCANGGRLLRDGTEDLDFTAAVTARLADAGAPLAEMSARMHEAVGASGAGFVKTVRDAEGLFCYAVVDRPALCPTWLEDLTGVATDLRWSVSLQGRKLYLVPAALTKGAAAREVADLMGASYLCAAGDSLLDADLLEVADAAIRPAHGELADTGWSRDHVTVTAATGIMAGEEIASWMRRHVLG